MRNVTLLFCGVAFGVAVVAAWGGVAANAAEPVAEANIPGKTGTVVIPGSSIMRAGDFGVRAHTNIELFFPAGIRAPASAPSGRYETPASLACVYGVTAFVAGCNPATLTTPATTGSKAIAIVDAFDYPTATNDLSVFSAEFGLPAITGNSFKVVYADGKKPDQDNSGGWELEAALDIEMVHAMAPNAEIFLVEAQTNSTADMLAAEKVAGAMVAASGGGEVSNSWTGGEQAGEKHFESLFKVPGVVYLASAGDRSGIGIPAALNDVIAVGGTTVNRDSKFNYIDQTAWASTGGGSSAYIVAPKFQSPVAKIVGAYRGTPDISLVANPITGVWIYDTTPYRNKVYDWMVVGGTSVAAPVLAGILNSAGSFAKSTMAELTRVYKGFGNQKNWTDITSGPCGNNGGTNAAAGWDFCTGVGAPQGLAGK